MCILLAVYIGITKDPQSMTVQVGRTATFQCAGTGDYVLWKINGEVYQDSSAQLQDAVFVVTRETVSGFKLSNLTVLTASAENNGTTVQCILTTVLPSSSASSNNATLTVLPGNLCFKISDDVEYAKVEQALIEVSLFLFRYW